ncbi:hypothetical protein FQR65_LT20097 [Abscondita terminalis]|nr:hypothetical protein FQR65_LT20097 [Abscondita terminalis]
MHTRAWVFGEPASSGEAPTHPLILVHGFRGDHHGLRDIAAALAATRPGVRAIVPDLPGFGATPPVPGRDHTLELYGEWLRVFAKAVAPEGCTILGHSFGSLVVSAAIAGGLDPERAVLINPIAAPALEGPKALLTQLAIGYYRAAEILPERAARRLLGDPLVVRLMSEVMAKTGDRQLRSWIHAQHASYFSSFLMPPRCCRRFARNGVSGGAGPARAAHRVPPAPRSHRRDAPARAARPSRVLSASRRVVVIEDLADHTNVGAVFRAVAALGADAVLLTPACADPLYRRAVRVSMGAVLQVPWARLPEWRIAGPMLREAGFELAAFALTDDAEDLATYVERLPERLALMFGTEGAGLSRRALASATRTVVIPMAHGVDSLNVATAAALALWAVRTADEQAETVLGAAEFTTEPPPPLNLVSIPAVAIALVVIGVIALFAHGIRRALVVTVVPAVAVLASQLLKLRLLTRPELFEIDAPNTFPSGHMTVFTVLVGALIWAVPIRVRALVALAGSVLIAAVGWQLLAYGWHRPSDVFGAVALGSTSFALAALIRPANSRGRALLPRTVSIGLVLTGWTMAAAALALLGLATLSRSTDPTAGTSFRLLGPAFVAAIAYVDPGNVAANLSAGASYGYLLVWVLVAANAMAVVVQYLSAKLGLVTGQSLPEILGNRLSKPARLLFWAQAELVAVATDLAEIIGGALALYILFGRRGQRIFERVILALLAIITVGFVAGLVVSPLDWAGIAAGMVPRFEGTATVLLAASMLGATVMPHAIYLHSSLARDRHGSSDDPGRIRLLLRATRWDVALALVLAGGVNIAMLLLAASSLPGVSGTDTIEGAAAAMSTHLGPAIGVIFGIGLLASGLASTSVGSYAGAEIMSGLLRVKIPLLVRRSLTLIPALVILTLGLDPTWSLVVSQPSRVHGCLREPAHTRTHRRHRRRDDRRAQHRALGAHAHGKRVNYTQSMYVKICGLRDAATALHAIAHGADAIGVVMSPSSPRHASAAQAAAVIEAAAVTQPVDTVLVVNRMPAAEAARTAARLGFDVLQLHGGYDRAEFEAAKNLFPRVWRATSLEHSPEVYAGEFGEERLLLDGSSPGSGTPWDLSRIGPQSPTRERLGDTWLLAGGLTPENVAAAIARFTRPVLTFQAASSPPPASKTPSGSRRFFGPHENSRRCDRRSRGSSRAELDISHAPL